MLARVVRQVSKNVARTVSGPFPIRAFSAMEKTEKVSPRGLKALIAKELKYETENPADNGADYEEAKKSVLKNFNISQKSGKATVTLEGKFGEENITVSFNVMDEDEMLPDMDEEIDYENAEDVEMDTAIKCSVRVDKGDDRVLFECNCHGETLDIVNVTPVFSKGSEEEFIRDGYPGPIFDDLEEDLQEAFHQYLEKRNINSDLAYFVVSHSRVREQELYLEWLSSMKGFLSK